MLILLLFFGFSFSVLFPLLLQATAEGGNFLPKNNQAPASFPIFNQGKPLFYLELLCLCHCGRIPLRDMLCLLGVKHSKMAPMVEKERHGTPTVDAAAGPGRRNAPKWL